MNHRLNIAQPCSYKEDNGKIIIKPNTYRPFILQDEILAEDNFPVCELFYTLPNPMSLFTEVWKAVGNVESFHPYEYFLVAYNVGLEDVYRLIKDKVVWTRFTERNTGTPMFLPAFGDNEPSNSEKYISYNDTHVLLGSEPYNTKLLKRKDV